MSIASAAFLILFIPFSNLIYHLLLRKTPMFVRNGFLLLASIGFYAWGEPVRLLLVLAIIAATWLLGKLCASRAHTRAGKWLVLITVLINAGALIGYKYLDFLLANVGYVIRYEFTPLELTIPLGLSCLCLSSVSYVADLYRGRCKPAGLMNTALYLSIFFKLTAGPVVQYHQFEEQLRDREVSLDQFTDGVWRFAVGYCKKMIISGNLYHVVNDIFNRNYSELTISMAWVGAFVYVLNLYIDFSGYTDMAIGVGRMFGFRSPENFNYPLMATSVSGFWRRWNITLMDWFRTYVYEPFANGPVARLKQRLAKRFSDRIAHGFCDLLAITAVWAAIGFWYGPRWTFLMWGLVNGLIVFCEKRMGLNDGRRLPRFAGWLYTFILIVFTRPLFAVATIGDAAGYYKAMLGLYGNSFICDHCLFLLREYGVFLMAGIVCALPIGKWLMGKVRASGSKTIVAIVQTCMVLGLFVLFFLALSYSVASSDTTFIYGIS